ncbi:MAG: radical SAM protein, partial [Oscillospiraceae bacterium]|nr:radical SAM protein [Oscillospiraceae bacterium]
MSLQDQQQFAAKVQQLLADKPSQTAYVHSYGCQANVAEGEKIKGVLSQMGYGFTEDIQQADLILLNTCAVREGAEDRVFGNVGALKHQKRRNPELVIGLCGCMMQQKTVVDRLRRSFPHVDLVFGTNAIHRLPQMLFECLTHGRVIEKPEDVIDTTVVEEIPTRRDNTLKAWLPIMYGCDNFCSYCIVPYVRGRERSRSPKRVLEEARRIIAGGAKEITLLGQNVNSYGKGLPEEERMNFAQLLREINAIPGEFRIRFM